MTDTTPPTIAVASNVTRFSISQSAVITFTLSEPSSNFTVGDVTVYGGTLSNFSGNGSVYTAVYTAQFTGFVRVPSSVFSDFAGNVNQDGVEANNLIKLVVNQAPASKVGPTQYTKVGTAVTLNGTGSSDPDGDELSYRWTIVQSPIGSIPVLKNQYSAQPVFSSETIGIYVFALVVNDGLLDSSISAATVLVASPSSIENYAPIADAGPTQYVKPGEAVTLNGSNSVDPNGDQLTYRWQIVSQPIGSAPTLTNQFSAQPLFVADKEGDYYLGLIVNDGLLSSGFSIARVQVSLPNTAPVANAGKFQSVELGPVTLDGTSSFDAEGNKLTYKWYLVSKPINSKATLSSSYVSKPNLTLDIAGEYVFTLVVNDGKVDSAPSPTVVVANPPSIRIVEDNTYLRAGLVKTITFYLSQPSTNFELSDVTVTGGTLSNWLGNGDTYTALFTPFPNSNIQGNVSVTSGAFTDSAGNANADGSDANNTVVFSIDTVVPTISLSTNKSSLNSGETAIVNFTISEPSINFTASDVTVIGGTLSNFSGSGTAYTATFTPAVNSSINGVISVSSGVFTDLAGNTNVDGFDSNNAVSIAQVVKDLAPPSPIFFSPSLGEKNVDVSRNIVITFNEKIQRGSGVIDIRLGHPTLGNLLESFNVATSDRLTYDGTTLTINPTRDLKGNYYLFIYLADDAVQDSAGNKSVNISYYTITTANQTTTENYSLSVVVNKGVLGAEPVLLKDLTESFVFENGYTKKHIVEYAGSTFDYNQIDSLIMTVTRDGEFTEEFSREINDYLGKDLNITYPAAVTLVGAASIDAVILAVAGADGNYVG